MTPQTGTRTSSTPAEADRAGQPDADRSGAGRSGAGRTGAGRTGAGRTDAGRTDAGRPGTGRVNQKARTRAAIIQAVQDLARAGAEITMPSVARAALVSEATAYRYFPDLVSLLLEADAGSWPDPAEALAPVAASNDPVERVGYATEVLLTGILSRQSAVRAMIAASISHPDVAATRPGHRFALIDLALAPLASRAGADPRLAQLRQGLAVVMSAEALFVLTDLCGLSPRDAVASAVRTARSLTAAALRPPQP